MAETQPILAFDAHQEINDAATRRKKENLAYYYRHRERISAAKKQKYQATREKQHERNRENYVKNKERILGYKKKHRDANKVVYAERKKVYRLKNPSQNRAYNLKKKYGLTLEKYGEMFASQNGLCGICRKAEETRYLAVDHCHETGRIRGLLCAKCNTTIGRFRDDPEQLESAAAYLRRHHA